MEGSSWKEMSWKKVTEHKQPKLIQGTVSQKYSNGVKFSLILEDKRPLVEENYATDPT